MKRLLYGTALFCGGFSCGCSSTLAWYGHTPDRTQRIEVQVRSDEQRLVIGDQTSVPYEVFATKAFVFAAGGRHVAVAAARKGDDGQRKWHVLRDFREGAAWDSLAKLDFSPEGVHLAYVAERNRRWHMVVDEKPGPSFDTVQPDTISWSPDGQRWGYVAQEGSCVRAVFETEVGRCFRQVIGISTGKTSAHDMTLAVLLSDDPRVHLFVGGQARGAWAGAKALYVDPSGEHWAILAETEFPEDGLRMVVDGREQPVFEKIAKFVWAPNGLSFAYAAWQQANWFVMENERLSRPYDTVEKPVFSSDGRHVGHVGYAALHGFVVVDGQTVWWDKYPVTALTFDPQGKRKAFMYRDAQGPVIAVDETRHRYDVVIDGSLRFSQDGQHWAAIVGSLAQKKLSMVMDGQTPLPFDSEEFFGGGLYRNLPDPFGTWVSGELELRLRGHHARK